MTYLQTLGTVFLFAFSFLATLLFDAETADPSGSGWVWLISLLLAVFGWTTFFWILK